MDSEALKTGKARVREHLVEPLTRMGLVRPRSQTVEDHAAFVERLAARLAYMTVAGLEALAEVVERGAEGRARNTWPSEVSICNWARLIEAPPPSDSRLVTSWLRSEAGRRACEEGHIAELYLYLKRVGMPPNAYAMSTIRDEADENRRRRIRVRDRVADGTADPADEAWLRWYWDQRARALAIRGEVADAGEVAA